MNSPLVHPLIKALIKLVDWLNRQKIPYMVFGGIANPIYGNPRQTFDIDIKIILESGNSVGDYIQRMDRFNQWEKEEKKDILHQRHLEALIQTQKQLKVAFESH